MTYPVTVLPEPDDLEKRLKKDSWRMYYVKSECYIGNVKSVEIIDQLKQETYGSTDIQLVEKNKQEKEAR